MEIMNGAKKDLPNATVVLVLGIPVSYTHLKDARLRIISTIKIFNNRIYPALCMVIFLTLNIYTVSARKGINFRFKS